MAKEATSECCNMLPTCPLLVNDCVASVSSLPWGMSTARCWKKVCQIRFDVMHNHVNNAQQAALLQIAASATSRTHRVIRPSYLFHKSWFGSRAQSPKKSGHTTFPQVGPRPRPKAAETEADALLEKAAWTAVCVSCVLEPRGRSSSVLCVARTESTATKMWG